MAAQQYCLHIKFNANFFECPARFFFSIFRYHVRLQFFPMFFILSTQ